jgi:hypothetical protein
MKTFAILCIVAGLLFGTVLVLTAEKQTDFQTTDAAGDCTVYACSVTVETGTFCRISSTGYRAYPSMNSTAGYRDCLNRTTLARGVWTVYSPPMRTYSFNETQCMFVDNMTMCFGSSNVVENQAVVDAIARTAPS